MTMDACADQQDARPRVKGRRPFLAAMVIDSVGTGMFLPFTVLYFIHTAGLTAPAVGVALTVAGFVVLPAPLAVAPAIDRLPARIVVAAGNLIGAAAFGAYLVARGQLAVTAAAAAAGAGQATFWTGTRALISEVAPPGERRSWFALQTAISNAGYGLGGLAGAAAVSLHSPSGFKALAATDAASFLAAALLLISWHQPPAAARPAKPPAPGRVRSSYWLALTDRSLAAVAATNAAFVLCAQVLTVVLAVYVTATLHLAAWIAGMLYTLNTLLIAAGQAPVTLVTRRITHRHMLRGAAATWAVAFGLLWAAAILPRGARPGVLAAAITIFTLAEIGQGPVINALVTELAPASNPGAHLSIFQLSWSVGQTIAPAVLLALLSADPAWLWATTISLCLIIFLGTGHLTPAPTAATTNPSRQPHKPLAANVQRFFRNERYVPGMDEFRARRVVDALRDRGVDAHLLRGGVGQFGVRVPLPGGRQAEWDTDGTAGLEAQVMRDGMLVGYVPRIEGSEDFDESRIVDAIARTDYDQPVAHQRTAAPAPARALTREGGVFRRFLDGFRYK